jgi:hypothetical protein
VHDELKTAGFPQDHQLDDLMLLVARIVGSEDEFFDRVDPHVLHIHVVDFEQLVSWLNSTSRKRTDTRVTADHARNNNVASLPRFHFETQGGWGIHRRLVP